MSAILFAVLLVLQAADVVTTRNILARGGRELNPLVRRIMKKFGVTPGLAVKFVVSVALGAVLLRFDAVVALALLDAFFVVVVVNNIMVLRRMT